MNEVQQIEYLINAIDKATQKGVYNLQTATNCGIILNALLNDAKEQQIKKEKS